MAHHYYTSVSHRDLAAHQATQKEVSLSLPFLLSRINLGRSRVQARFRHGSGTIQAPIRYRHGTDSVQTQYRLGVNNWMSRLLAPALLRPNGIFLPWSLFTSKLTGCDASAVLSSGVDKAPCVCL